MGPGLWRDTLDVHFGNCNWTKVVGLSEYLAARMYSLVSHLIWQAQHSIARWMRPRRKERRTGWHLMNSMKLWSRRRWDRGRSKLKPRSFVSGTIHYLIAKLSTWFENHHTSHGSPQTRSTGGSRTAARDRCVSKYIHCVRLSSLPRSLLLRAVLFTLQIFNRAQIHRSDMPSSPNLHLCPASTYDQFIAPLLTLSSLTSLIKCSLRECTFHALSAFSALTMSRSRWESRVDSMRNDKKEAIHSHA